MPDFANERSGIALGREVAQAPAQASTPEVVAPLLSVRILSRERLDDATRALDGIGGLGWSVIGFVVGAVFWHFIGFWGFVANVVLAGGPPTAAEGLAAASGARSVIAQAAATGPTATGPTAVSAHTCTNLVLDRRSGTTVARACVGVFPPLPADSFEGREDRVAAAVN